MDQSDSHGHRATDGRIRRGDETRRTVLRRAVDVASVEGLDGVTIGDGSPRSSRSARAACSRTSGRRRSCSWPRSGRRARSSRWPSSRRPGEAGRDGPAARAARGVARLLAAAGSSPEAASSPGRRTSTPRGRARSATRWPRRTRSGWRWSPPPSTRRASWARCAPTSTRGSWPTSSTPTSTRRTCGPCSAATRPYTTWRPPRRATSTSVIRRSRRDTEWQSDGDLTAISRHSTANGPPELKARAANRSPMRRCVSASGWSWSGSGSSA